MSGKFLIAAHIKRPGLTSYDTGIVVWTNEQGRLLREGRLALLDVEHRELAGRMAVFLAHLLKWQSQPERRSNSWRRTIAARRAAIARRDWEADAWQDGRMGASKETGIENEVFLERCPWTPDQVLDPEFLPD